MTAHARFVWLVLFGLALGWFEGAVVVYLRELGPPVGSSLPSIVLPRHVLITEIVREAASLVVLGSASVLAGVSAMQRFAGFLLVFGLWDLAYYVTLRVITGWPARLTDPDVLFLIPVPWVGPVWAPALLALVFVSAGSYVFLTPDRGRRYRARDWLIEVAAAVGIVASFLPLSSAPWTDLRADAFTPWLYWVSLWLGLAWFIVTEWRERARRG